MRLRSAVLVAVPAFTFVLGGMELARAPLGWSAPQAKILGSLWIGSLPPPPPDPSNRWADDPRAVALGHRLFFDPRLSGNGEISCASCHRPDRHFTDGLPRGRALAEAARNTPTVVGAAWSPWLFWDGRKDSLWAQALAPLEHPGEHGGTRTQVAWVVVRHYRAEYEALFGRLPDLSDPARFPVEAGPHAGREGEARWQAMSEEARQAVTEIAVHLGKAIAAYERQLRPGASRFDRYVEALVAGDRRAMAAALSSDEVAGLRLFLGKADCTQCHSGPLLTHHGFHNVGTPGAPGLPPLNGRIEAVQEVLLDPFNCLGPWSDAPVEACRELRFLKLSGEELFGAVRTPSLRNVGETAPYMSAGQLESLAEVLVHYNEATDRSPVGHSDLQPLGLSANELAQLEAFLRSLDGAVAAPAWLLRSSPFSTPPRLAAPAGGSLGESSPIHDS